MIDYDMIIPICIIWINISNSNDPVSMGCTISKNYVLKIYEKSVVFCKNKKEP